MLNARFYGSKPYKAAVIHGGPGALGSVAAVARELSKDFGVIEPLQTRNSIEELLLELDGVISSSCDSPIALVGHSWGAWLAFIYAARFKQKVSRLVLVGSGPFEGRYVPDLEKRRMERLSEAERNELYDLFGSLSRAKEKRKDELFGRIGEIIDKCDNYSTFVIESDQADRFSAASGQYDSIWNEAEAMRKSGELLSLADEIDCPVAAVHGEYDPHPGEGVRRPLKGCLKDFRFYSLDKCGHTPWKEKHAFEEFYRILRNELGPRN